MGYQFQSDGRLYGEASVETIACDTAAGTCNIPVPAPSVAVVYLNDAALANSGGEAGETNGSTLTFATTITTAKHTPVIFDMAAVNTSNGHNSGTSKKGATSKNAAIPKPSSSTRSASIGGTTLVLMLGSTMLYLASLL